MRGNGEDMVVDLYKEERKRNLELADLLFCAFEFQVSCVEKCDFVSNPQHLLSFHKVVIMIVIIFAVVTISELRHFCKCVWSCGWGRKIF